MANVKMSRFQRWVIRLTALAIVLMVMCPPWVCIKGNVGWGGPLSLLGSGGSFIVQHLGYNWLWCRLQNVAVPNVPLLVLQILAVTGLGAALCLTTKPGNSQIDKTVDKE